MGEGNDFDFKYQIEIGFVVNSFVFAKKIFLKLYHPTIIFGIVGNCSLLARGFVKNNYCFELY